MFRGMGGGIVCKLCEKWSQISRKVMKMVSWRGLGEVLGALGAALGPQGGPTNDLL